MIWVPAGGNNQVSLALVSLGHSSSYLQNRRVHECNPESRFIHNYSLAVFMFSR